MIGLLNLLFVGLQTMMGARDWLVLNEQQKRSELRIAQANGIRTSKVEPTP
jgi:hypothetical protein